MIYQIYKDASLIYDSSQNNKTIIKGLVNLELNRSGSFSFTVSPLSEVEFINYKSIIKVMRDDEILFRGRVISQSIDFRKQNTILCEGELSFFNDVIILNSDITNQFTSIVSSDGTMHYTDYLSTVLGFIVDTYNSRVDSTKQFTLGTVDDWIITENNQITRDYSWNESCKTWLDNILNNTDFYFTVTHENGDIPTLNFKNSLNRQATQSIVFGSNLLDLNKKDDEDYLYTAMIPIYNEDINSYFNIREQYLLHGCIIEGSEIVKYPSGVDTYGYICKVVDVTNEVNNAYRIEKQLHPGPDAKTFDQVFTETCCNMLKDSMYSGKIELSAVDLHMIDSNIESFKLGDNIRVLSNPHEFDDVLLCNKLSINIMRPDNDKLTLGKSIKSNLTNSLDYVGKEDKKYKQLSGSSIININSFSGYISGGRLWIDLSTHLFGRKWSNISVSKRPTKARVYIGGAYHDLNVTASSVSLSGIAVSLTVGTTYNNYQVNGYFLDSSNNTTFLEVTVS